MSATKKQKEREKMAEVCDDLFGKENRTSRWYRRRNKEVEKRKRRQFNENDRWQ